MLSLVPVGEQERLDWEAAGDMDIKVEVPKMSHGRFIWKRPK